MLGVKLTIGDQEHVHEACQHYRLNPAETKKESAMGRLMDRRKKQEKCKIKKNTIENGNRGSKNRRMCKTSTDGPKITIPFNILH